MRLVEIALAKSFDDVWATELTAKTDGEIKDAVNSIVANRHNIAHGQDTRITVTNVKKWHMKSRKLIKIIEEHCEFSA